MQAGESRRYRRPVDIGFVGLGKLGLPCALAAESRGHRVRGTDVDPAVRQAVDRRIWPHRENSVPELLATSQLEVVDLVDLVATSEIVFVVVATPHAEGLDGASPLGDIREDFNYAQLSSALTGITAAAAALDCTPAVAIVSTVLPGTVERIAKPLVRDRVRLSYNPCFASMGHVIEDYLDPEFVLLGADDEDAFEPLNAYYSELTNAPVLKLPIIDAELAKVAYNTFIGLKIVFANALMELSEKVGADVDNVTYLLKNATRRIVSTAYMDAGMGDGGSCHPRDGIALSWLAREVGLSHDIFTDVMSARDDQTRWLAELVDRFQGRVTVLGKAFKADSNVTAGSAAVLLASMLASRGRDVRAFDPFVDDGEPPLDGEIFVIATNHSEFGALRFAPGSVVIDPWAIVGAQDQDVTVIAPGRRARTPTHKAQLG